MFEVWYQTRYLGWTATATAFAGLVAFPLIFAPLTWTIVALLVVGERSYRRKWRITRQRLRDVWFALGISVLALVAPWLDAGVVAAIGVPFAAMFLVLISVELWKIARHEA